MKCPFCSTADTQVIDSRVNEAGDSIRRRRKCQQCEKRFTTYESADLGLPVVVKQDGKREDFKLEKLSQSFARALHKRPVPAEYVEQAISNIVQKFYPRERKKWLPESLESR
jgi:transcriptional repressor NrdR